MVAAYAFKTHSEMVRIDPTLCHCLALRKAARRATLHYDRALSGSGLTIGQFAILAELHAAKGAAPLSISGLAARLAMDRTALTHTLKPMLRDGLLELRPSASDARVKQVTLTAEGTARVEASAALWEKAQAGFEAMIGAHEAGALRALLEVTDRLPHAPPDEHG